MRENELWIEYIPLSKLKEWPRNPKRHADEDIDASIDEFGFTDPITIDETSGKMVAGHGRLNRLVAKHKAGMDIPENIKIAADGEWLAPVIRGNSFADSDAIERYLLTVNRLVEKGGWNEELLAVMVEQLQPTGFDIVAEAEDLLAGLPRPDDIPKIKVEEPKLPPETSENENKSDPSIDFEDLPGVLNDVWELNENVIYPTVNEYGIPELRSDMLCEELPKNLKTWAGHTVTPDDGVSNYLWSYGATPARKVPYSRTIICFFTHDSHIETWWNAPSYRVGQMLMAGLKTAVVPDVSLWEKVEMPSGEWVQTPKVLQIYATYRAQWLGRFFQDAGLYVIPRFEYFLPECREFSMMGVPIGAPVLATQLHTGFEDEHIPRIKESFKLGIEKFSPVQLLVYASEKGANIVDDCKLPCEVVVVPTVKKLAKPKDSYKETDPHLIELRKRKRGFERTKTTGGQ